MPFRYAKPKKILVFSIRTSDNAIISVLQKLDLQVFMHDSTVSMYQLVSTSCNGMRAIIQISLLLQRKTSLVLPCFNTLNKLIVEKKEVLFSKKWLFLSQYRLSRKRRLLMPQITPTIRTLNTITSVCTCPKVLQTSK